MFRPIKVPSTLALACTCVVIALSMEMAFADSSPKEVFAKGTSIRCFLRHEGWITTTTGPCEGFTPPARIAIGATFKANGKDRTVGAITATQSDADWTYSDFRMHKGEWACAAAETESDLAEGRYDALWLSIVPCQPALASE
jgi:hypothetical protein